MPRPAWAADIRGQRRGTHTSRCATSIVGQPGGRSHRARRFDDRVDQGTTDPHRGQAATALNATVATTAWTATVLVFLAWLRQDHGMGRLRPLAAFVGVLALVSVGFELAVTALSLVSVAGTAERVFFGCALAWMTVARYAVSASGATSASSPATGSAAAAPCER